MAGIFGLIGAAAGLAGEKPEVPKYTPVDAQKAQKSAIGGNLAALPQAEQLSSALNVFNQQQLQNMLEKAIPDYSKIGAQTSKDILSMLKGELPDAVQTATRAAAKAVGGGFSGSEAARNLTLRDLSIESLGYTQAGINAANRWIQTQASVGVPQLSSPSSMFVTPAQQLQTDMYNSEQQWNRDWLSNRISAMPGPLEQEAMGTFDWMDSMGKSILGSYIGMATGSAMGGGGAGAGNWATGGPSTMQMFGSTPPTGQGGWGSSGGRGNPFFGM